MDNLVKTAYLAVGFVLGAVLVLTFLGPNVLFWLVVVVGAVAIYKAVRSIVWHIKHRRFFSAVRVSGQAYAVIGVLIFVYGLRILLEQQNEAVSEESMNNGFTMFMHGNSFALFGWMAVFASRMFSHIDPYSQLTALMEFVERPTERREGDEEDDEDEVGI